MVRKSPRNDYTSKYPNAAKETNGLSENNKMIEESTSTELIQLIKDIGRKLEVLESKHPHSASECPQDTCITTTDAKARNINDGNIFVSNNTMLTNQSHCKGVMI